MKGYIYKITSPSNRIYIGQTINIKRRIIDYKTLHCKHQKLIYYSLLKYGWESHKFEIIEEVQFCGINNWLIDKLEIYWIKEYKSNKHRYRENNGLNLNDGGSTNLGFKHSDESKSKMSKSKKGIKTGPCPSKARIGKDNGNFGKPKTQEIKDKISNSKKGKYSNNGIKIDAYNYKTGEYIGTYKSYTDCIKQLNIPRHICEVINGKRNHAGGYTFKLSTEDKINN